MQSDSRGDTLRRITKAALGGLAGCALVLGGTGVASGELLDILKIHRDSNDVNASTVALDSAKAKITIDKGTDSEGRENTTFAIRVTGIDVSGIDFSQPVKVVANGREVFNAKVQRDLKTLLKWAAKDNDRTMLYAAEVKITLR